MDNSIRTIACDSSTTAEDMCKKLVKKNRLDDPFGYTMYIAFDEKVLDFIW